MVRVTTLYHTFWRVWCVLLTFLVVGEAFGLVGPYIYGMILDSAYKKENLTWVLILAGCAFASTLTRIAIDWSKNVYETRKHGIPIRQFTSEQTLRAFLIENSIGQNLSANSSVRQSIALSGEQALTNLAHLMVYDLLPTVLHLIFTMCVLLVLSPVFGAIVLVGGTIDILVSLKINRIMGPRLERLQELDVAKQTFITEILRNTVLIKRNAQEHQMIKEFHSSYDTFRHHGTRTWLSYLGFDAARGIIPNFTQAIVLVTGILYVFFMDTYTPGYVFAVVLVWTGNALGAMSVIAPLQKRFLEAYMAINKYFHTVDEVNDVVEIADPIVLENIRGDIEFEDVSFVHTDTSTTGHPPHARTILSRINLSIKAGERVAIVGHSGAGKTTLTNLLLRAYDPTAGRILIDGVDLRHLDLMRFRRTVGTVEQDIGLFDNTVRYNIVFPIHGGPRSLTDECLAQIAVDASIEDLTSNERGFDTIVGERGAKLSGGERQRLAIARIFAKDPRILILDEATSSLDSKNEARIHAAIDRASAGRTTLIIAHRLSTIRGADKIVVLDHGTIVGMGNHEHLLAECATYEELVAHQMTIRSNLTTTASTAL